MFQTKVVENMKTFCIQFFLIVLFVIECRKILYSRTGHMTIWRMRVRETIVAEEKQQLLHILSVCVCVCVCL